MKKAFSSNKRKIKVLKKISSRLRVGKKALVCFSELAEKMENPKNPFYKLNPVYAFLNNSRQIMGSGGTLSACFEGWIDPAQLVLIKTGEVTGSVSDSIEKCVLFENKISTIKKTIRNAMIMPLVASVMLLGVLIGSYQKGIPLLLQMQDKSEWGDVALQYYDLSERFGGEPLITVAWVVGFIAVFRWAIPNFDIKKFPQIRDGMDKYFPFFGIYRTIQISLFLSSLSVLMASGIRVKEALELIEENSSRYVSNRIGGMIKKISSGEDFGNCFITPFLGESGIDLADMAQGDSLEAALNEVANETIEETLEILPMKLNLVGKLMIASCLGVIMFGMGAFYEIVGSLT